MLRESEDAVGSGQWAVGSGQWAVGSGQWAVGSFVYRENRSLTMFRDDKFSFTPDYPGGVFFFVGLIAVSADFDLTLFLDRAVFESETSD